jgi:hypothetical protein
MAILAGQRNTSNVDQTSRRLDIGSRIALLEPSQTPLTALLNKINSRKAISPKFTNYEDTLAPRVDTLNHGSNPGAGVSPITVSNGSYFNVEDLVLVPATKELMRVTAISTNALSVTRGVGSTAATITDGTQLYIVGSAALEGDVSKQARSATPTKVDNYTQIFRDPVDESGTALSSDFLFDEHDFDYTKRKKGIEHATRIERSFWWGRPSETGTPAVRTTGGFFHFQGSTNATDAAGSWTESELWTNAPALFRYGSGRKLMFASGLVLGVISQWAQGKVLTRTDDTTYGIAITELQAPSGRLGLVHHPLFDDTTVYNGYAAVLDMDSDIAKRFLAGGIGGSRDTHYVDNIQENDRDGRKGEYRSEVGLQIGQPQRHGYFYGVTGP